MVKNSELLGTAFTLASRNVRLIWKYSPQVCFAVPVLKPPKGFAVLLSPHSVFTLLLTWGLTAAATAYTPIEVPTGQRFSMMTFRDGQTHEERGVVWLDNQRIIFKGSKSVQNPEGEDPGIFIWDTARNQVTRYGKETQFCFSGGWTYLSGTPQHDEQSNSSTQSYRYGPFTREKPGLCERRGDEYRNCILSVNMSCKAVMTRRETNRPLGPESRVLFELRDDDGILVVARRWEDVKEKLNREEIVSLSRQPVLLMNKKHPKGKILAIEEVERIAMRRAAYSEYAKKYVFVGSMPKNSPPGQSTNWPEGMPQPVYLLGRDGELEIVEVPKLVDWTGIFLAMPSRKGLVYWGAHGRTGGGIFLYSGANTDALDRGYVGTFSITPDGCKAAYSIVNDYTKTRDLTFRIKYVNLCSEAK